MQCPSADATCTEIDPIYKGIQWTSFDAVANTAVGTVTNFRGEVVTVNYEGDVQSLVSNAAIEDTNQHCPVPSILLCTWPGRTEGCGTCVACKRTISGELYGRGCSSVLRLDGTTATRDLGITSSSSILSSSSESESESSSESSSS